MFTGITNYNDVDAIISCANMEIVLIDIIIQHDDFFSKKDARNTIETMLTTSSEAAVSFNQYLAARIVHCISDHARNLREGLDEKKIPKKAPLVYFYYQRSHNFQLLIKQQQPQQHQQSILEIQNYYWCSWSRCQ